MSDYSFAAVDEANSYRNSVIERKTMSMQIINGILKFFVMFILLSEMQTDVMQKCILFVMTFKKYKEKRDWFGLLFIVIFSMHMLSMCFILTLSDLWVFTSFSPLDAINNSLSILILN